MGGSSAHSAAALKPALAQPGDCAGVARAYAQHLLESLGIAARRSLNVVDEHPALSWARSGLMALTGHAEGPGLMSPVPLAACADGALAALASLAPDASAFADLRGSQLLSERAASARLARNGAVAPGGACRLLEAQDGSIALNLARGEDWDLVPAWLESGAAADWDAVATVIRHRQAAELIERGRMLGLAVAMDEWPIATPNWVAARPTFPRKRAAIGARVGSGRNRKAPLVVDLSSLWAGPLCSHLLQKLGARVVKVESPARPDGARSGSSSIFALLNAGKESVALDPRQPRECERLRRLIASADIVIEASRPRALRQLGLIAEDFVEMQPGLTWLSISGHGRGEPHENWIAYGDDAGVAAGLSSVMQRAAGQRVIVGDAIADPLTGLHAALAAWAGHLRGGGLYALSLREVVGHCVRFDLPPGDEALRARQEQWTGHLAETGTAVEPPRLRNPCDWAHVLGADTQTVLAEFGIA